MAIILTAFVDRCINLLHEFIEERAIMVLGIKDDIKRLRERLQSIECLLDAAEASRMQDPSIDRWVMKLKDVMYDADDMVDLCRIKGTKRERPTEDQASTSRSWMHSVSSVIPYLSDSISSFFHSYDIGNRIRSLNHKIKEITEDRYIISKLINSSKEAGISEVNPRQTSSLVEPDLVGREIITATKSLVEILVKEDKEKFHVIAIVGMGGIGKTALSQNVFNDPKIQDSFNGHAWICVSHKYSETNLLKELLRNFGVHYGEANTKSELQTLLGSAALGKKLFIVLDDVWKGDIWVNLLRNPLQVGATCSRILITTRDLNVAMEMKASHVQQVKELPTSVGWELLCKKAFSAGEENEAQNLKDVGIQIVEKCSGLPLAIKTIANVLSTRKCRKEWEKVLQDDAYFMQEHLEELRDALYLSYKDLPAYLKQCFLYFSLYPEDYKFSRFSIAELFIAEGFVPTGTSSLEDLANEYLEELFKKNMLRPSTVEFEYDPFMIHDLLRSLAKFLSRDECLFGDVRELKTNTGAKICRLSIAQRGETVAIPDYLVKKKCLRTVILLNSPPSLNSDVIARLPSLRVLVLNGPGIDNIPDSIGGLIHLRCLDLCRTMVSGVPKSIGCLKNLQVLRLRSCKLLQTLPTNVTQLSNLLCFDVENTPLSHVSKGIGQLQHLSVLSGFTVGDDTAGSDGRQGCDLEELRPLSELRCLGIDRLERAVSGASDILANKTYLRTLSLVCMPNHVKRALYTRQHTEEDTNRIQGVFEELFPPPNLQKLCINNYFGRRFPSWMASPSLGTYFPVLTSLCLMGIKSCTQLPPLGQMPQLRLLWIEGAFEVINIGYEFLYNDMNYSNPETMSTIFPKLEVLKIENMYKWEGWLLNQEILMTGIPGPQSLLLLPQLQKLYLKNCPKLRALPEGLQRRRKMDFLLIEENQNLWIIENIPFSRLQITDCSCLKRIANLQALKNLCIRDCPALECVENLDMLECVEVKDVAMERLPQWLWGLIQHRQQKIPNDNLELIIECSISVLERCVKEGPDWSIIQQFP